MVAVAELLINATGSPLWRAYALPEAGKSVLEEVAGQGNRQALCPHGTIAQPLLQVVGDGGPRYWAFSPVGLPFRIAPPLRTPVLS